MQQLIINKYRIIVSGVSTILLCSAISSALYADPLKNLEDSWYVGGAVGLSRLNPKTTGLYDVTDNGGLSAKVYAGVDISNHWGIEAFWSKLGESEVRGSNGDDASVDYSALGVNALYHIPLNNSPIKPFAKLGIARINTDSKNPAVHTQENNFSLLMGLGAEYELNNQLRLRAEYDYFSKDINQLTVGLNWSPNSRAPLKEKKIVKRIPAALPINIPVSRPKPQPIRTVVVNKPQPVRTVIVNRPVVRTVVEKPIYIPAAPRKTVVKTINSNFSGGSLFATNSALLTAAGRAKIIELKQQINQSGITVNHVQIIGHTDSKGSKIHNLRLSQQRAQSVARFLQSQGIQRRLMSVVGYGEERPIATNRTEFGRATNRRVEIRIRGIKTLVTNG